MTVHVYYASQVAAQIGENPFVPVEKTLLTVWERREPTTLKDALARNKKIPIITPAEVYQKAPILVKEKLDEIIETATPETITEMIRTVLAEEKSLTYQDVKEIVYTTRGTRDEEKSINTYSQQSKKRVIQRNDKFYRKYFSYNDGGVKKEFLIGGKTDGITEDGTLIEVKNRQRSIMQPIPYYELIQVHVYMILTGLLECTFVQTCGDETVSELIEFDAQVWDDILTKLKDYSLQLDQILECPEKQDELISSSTSLL